MPDAASQEMLDPLLAAEELLRYAGVAIIVLAAAALTYKRRWSSAARLPRPPETDIGAIDVAVGLYLLMFFPVVFGYMLGVPAAGDATSQPVADPAALPRQAIAAALAQLCAAACILWLGIRRSKGGAKAWGLRLTGLPRDLSIAVLAYVALWPICATLLEETEFRLDKAGIELPMHSAIETLQRVDLPSLERVLTVLGAIVLAPLVEELFFRGILQAAIARICKSQWTAVLISGIAFGAIHYPYWQTIPALIFFGLVLGYAYARTGSLTLVILIHAVFNAKTILWLSLSA